MGIPVSSCLPCVLPVLRLMLLLAIPLHLPRKSPPQPTQCASAEAPKSISISISISISLPSLSRELAFLKFLMGEVRRPCRFRASGLLLPSNRTRVPIQAGATFRPSYFGRGRREEGGRCRGVNIECLNQNVFISMLESKCVHQHPIGCVCLFFLSSDSRADLEFTIIKKLFNSHLRCRA